jgi:hypothetical protein
MDVVVRGQRVTLNPKDAVGSGGEATITKCGGKAIKVYHQQNDERAKKLVAMIKEVTPRLPAEVLGPQTLVYNSKGTKVVGFEMNLLPPGYEVLSSLSRKSYRNSTHVGTKTVTSLFLTAHDTLSGIHQAGAVVGDLNDLNEMFMVTPQGQGKVAWIDVDSFQVPNHPCEVATETFLDPNLYGPDVTAPVLMPTGQYRIFKPENDWYSYTVLLFRSLTLVHPYGGVDPALPTIPRRAKAGKSVFNVSVRYPAKIGYSLEVMSDDLIQYMTAVFDKGYRLNMPRALLEGYAAGLVACPQCLMEYDGKRRKCPGCAATAPPPVMTLTTDRAGCSATDLLHLDGNILSMASMGDLLRILSYEERELVVYDITNGGVDRVSLGSRSPDSRVDASPGGYVAWSGRNDSTVNIAMVQGGRIRNSILVPTEKVGDWAAFGVSNNYFYRIAAGILLRCTFGKGSSTDERPLTTVMTSQTWFKVSKVPTSEGDVLFGASRIFGEQHYFMIVGNKRIDLEFGDLRKPMTVTDTNVTFSSQTVALIRKVLIQGAERLHLMLFDLNGNLLSNCWLDPTVRMAGGSMHGGALSAKSLLLATDRGIVREKLNGVAPEEEKLFDATEPFISADSEIQPFRGGLAVSHGTNIRLLKLT